MKRLFKFKYPKLTILTVMIILAYILFENPAIASFFSHLGNLSYLGIFLAGILFAFGFTAPFAIGIFLSSTPESIILASIIGAWGATLSDLFIFKVIKCSFMNEFRKLEKNKEIKFLEDEVSLLPIKIKHYLLYIFAGIVIASPLPDEVGVTMLTGLAHIKAKTLAISAIVLHFLGILILLLI